MDEQEFMYYMRRYEARKRKRFMKKLVKVLNWVFFITLALSINILSGFRASKGWLIVAGIGFTLSALWFFVLYLANYEMPFQDPYKQ